MINNSMNEKTEEENTVEKNIFTNTNINNINTSDKDNKEKNKSNDGCQELKNIAYKTMLLNGNNINPIYEIKNEKIRINSFLENESNDSKNEAWNKLDKTQKIKQLNKYVENIGKDKYNLDIDGIDLLKKYLNKCLDRKNLLKTKEVIYDRITGEITNIPYLFYNKEDNIFILKKDDKHISTIKSLPPDKKVLGKTLKNKN